MSNFKKVMMAAAGSSGLEPAQNIVGESRGTNNNAASHVHEFGWSGTSGAAVDIDYGLRVAGGTSDYYYEGKCTTAHPLEKIALCHHRGGGNSTKVMYTDFIDCSNPASPSYITRLGTSAYFTDHSTFNRNLSGSYHKEAPFILMTATHANVSNQRTLYGMNVGPTSSDCAVYAIRSHQQLSHANMNSYNDVVVFERYNSSSRYIVEIAKLTGPGILGGLYSNITQQYELEHPNNVAYNLRYPQLIEGTDYMICWSQYDQYANQASSYGSYKGCFFVYDVSNPASPSLVLNDTNSGSFYDYYNNTYTWYDEENAIYYMVSGARNNNTFIKRWDMSNPTSPSYIGQSYISSYTYSAWGGNKSYGWSQGDTGLWSIHQTGFGNTHQAYWYEYNSSGNIAAIGNITDGENWFQNVANTPGGVPSASYQVSGRISFL